MSDGGAGGFGGPMGIPPGGNDFHDRENDRTPWYRRWYVWVLPGAVIIGAVVTLLGQR